MSNTALAQRIPKGPYFERQIGVPDTGPGSWQEQKNKANENTTRRRRLAERAERMRKGFRKLNIGTLLTGGALLATDSFIHTDLLSDAAREAVLNVGTAALGAGILGEIGTHVTREAASGPDKNIDNAVEQTMKLNKLGGKHLAAKIGKTAAWLAKWGAISVAGIAAVEWFGADNEAIAQNFIEKLPGVNGEVDLLSNIPDIEPSMFYPAAATAVGAEVGRKLFKTQDEVYDAATDFIRSNPEASKKSSEKKEYDTAKKEVKEKSGKMVWSKLFTGDIAESVWWHLQKQKFQNEGKLGSGSATLSEIVRKRNSGLENLITSIKKYQSLPFIAAGITGLIAPALNGPLPAAMETVDPAIWAGLTMAGAGKYAFIDKPQADFYNAFKTATEQKLSTGRDKHVVRNV